MKYFSQFLCLVSGLIVASWEMQTLSNRALDVRAQSLYVESTKRARSIEDLPRLLYRRASSGRGSPPKNFLNMGEDVGSRLMSMGRNPPARPALPALPAPHAAPAAPAHPAPALPAPPSHAGMAGNNNQGASSSRPQTPPRRDGMAGRSSNQGGQSSQAESYIQNLRGEMRGTAPTTAQIQGGFTPEHVQGAQAEAHALSAKIAKTLARSSSNSGGSQGPRAATQGKPQASGDSTGKASLSTTSGAGAGSSGSNRGLRRAEKMAKVKADKSSKAAKTRADAANSPANALARAARNGMTEISVPVDGVPTAETIDAIRKQVAKGTKDSKYHGNAQVLYVPPAETFVGGLLDPKGESRVRIKGPGSIGQLYDSSSSQGASQPGGASGMSSGSGGGGEEGMGPSSGSPSPNNDAKKSNADATSKKVDPKMREPKAKDPKP